MSESLSIVPSLDNNAFESGGYGNFYSESGAGLRSLQRQLESIQSELQREQNLRNLDKQQYEQTESILRKQMKFILEESNHYKSLLEQHQDQSAKDIQQYDKRLKETLECLREVEQEKLEAINSVNRNLGSNNVSLSLQKEKVLQARLSASHDEIEALRIALQQAERRAIKAEKVVFERSDNIHQSEERREEDLDSDKEHEECRPDRDSQIIAQSVISKRQQMNRIPTTPEEIFDETYGCSASGTSPKKRKRSSHDGDCPFSSAPESVLKELTKTRLTLAESERMNRTLARQLESSDAKFADYKQLQQSVERLEEQLESKELAIQLLRREVSELEEVKKLWISWRRELVAFIPAATIADTNLPNSNSSLMPPELASVSRQFLSIQQKLEISETEKDQLSAETKILKQRLAQLDKEKKEDSQVVAQLQAKQKDHTKVLHILQMKVESSAAAERIAKSETESLRKLIDTFEIEERASTRLTPGIQSTSSSAEGLRASLIAANEEIQSLKQANEKSNEELQALQKQYSEDRQKNEIVLQKFAKLRDALMTERDKSTNAEARAIRAETLAGKGWYNKETTQLLHMKENPLVIALRAKYEKEINTLKEQVQRHRSQIEGDCVAASARRDGKCSCGYDEKKMNQRLKESFKEQIGLFREGVYLMTGYKIDMTIEGDRPKFKVRSFYAERESDQLMFMWPVSETGGKGRASAPATLDLLATDLAESLSKTDTFQYLSKYSSIPAFMAALTLKLFENTTFV